jgi:hypothetical protein
MCDIRNPALGSNSNVRKIEQHTLRGPVTTQHRRQKQTMTAGHVYQRFDWYRYGVCRSAPGGDLRFCGQVLVMIPVSAWRLAELTLERATERSLRFVADVGGNVRDAARRPLE